MASLISTISKILNQPFPEHESPKDSIQGLLIAAVIVFLVLFGFRPFGLQYLEGEAIKYCIAFGLITFLVGLFYEFVLLKIVPFSRSVPVWKFWHWLVEVLGMILFIAIANYLFAIYLSSELEYNATDFLAMLGNTYLVAILPIIIGGLISQNRLLKKHVLEAQNLIVTDQRDSSEKVLLELAQNDGRTELTLALNQLWYIQAMQNYIRVVYQDDGQVVQKTMRSSIKNIKQQVSSPPIYQCHRSFLVQLSHVKRITGNAQGLQLHFDENNMIPVSRKYIPTIKKEFSQASVA